MGRNKKIILLGFIVLLGAIVRLIFINKIPVSLYWDEMSIGYNAYSILHTGRDEYGVLFPLIFRAFNDYKLGGYIYLTTIAEFLFGLNAFSIRFFSAFLGTFTILVIYFLTKEILNFSESYIKKTSLIALISALFFAISPWAINFSRAGFEANVGLFFITLSVWLFLKYISGNKTYLSGFSTLSAVIGIYCYRSEFIFVPLILLFLIILFKDHVKENMRVYSVNFLIFVILLLPLIFALKTEIKSDRAVSVSVVNNAFDDQVLFSRLRLNFNNIFGKAIFNNKTAIVYKTVQNYGQNLNPSFLFIKGDPNSRHKIFDMGMLYLFDGPFILLGLYKLLRSKGKSKYIIIYWLFIGFIPAAISDINPHALRSLNNAAIFPIFSAIGVISFIDLFKNKTYRDISSYTIIFIYLISFINFIYLYFFITPDLAATDWGDGYKQLYDYVSTQKSYDKIIISGHWWEPYVYFLVYSKYDPSKFQKNGSVFGFDRYIFGGTSWDLKNPNHTELDHLNLEKLAKTKNFLVALYPGEYMYQKKNVRPILNIYNKSNKLMFIVAKNRY